MQILQPAFLALILFGVVNTGFSQSIVNSNFTRQVQAGEVKYLISYDIESKYDNIPCRVSVKLTADMNGISNTFYLKEVSGDVGDLIYPGKNKKIVWDHQEELIHFSGEINLDIEVVPCIQIDKKIKRGKEFTTILTPIFTDSKPYSIKLFQAGKETTMLKSGSITGERLPIQMPKETRIKKNYQLVISDGEKAYYSNVFKVRRKVSLGWVIVPAIAVPAYLLINQYLKDNEPLPGPPGSGFPNGG